jgi:hypothetical protein
MAGSAGVTPAYVGLEPTLILSIDPPRRIILLRRGARTRGQAETRFNRAIAILNDLQ